LPAASVPASTSCTAAAPHAGGGQVAQGAFCALQTWEKQALSARGVQARRKALRMRFINGMGVRKKRTRGFKKRPRGFK
jgi:hypothetical protein